MKNRLLSIFYAHLSPQIELLGLFPGGSARESQIRRALNAGSQELIQHRLDERCREGAAVFVQETLRCQLGRDRDMRPGERGILSPYP